MQDLNPFEAPRQILRDQEDGPEYFVDGDHLIVKSGAQLPPRCIFTNQPLSDSELVKEWLAWKGGSFRLTPGASIYCGISPRIHWENRRAIAFSVFGLLTTLPAFAIFQYFDIGRAATLALLLVLMLLSAYVNSRLFKRRHIAAVNFREPYFEVTGCGREFLDSLENQADELIEPEHRTAG